MRKDDWGDLIPENVDEHVTLASEQLPGSFGEGGCREYEIQALSNALGLALSAIRMLEREVDELRQYLPETAAPRYKLEETQ